MPGYIPRRCSKSVSDRLALGIANNPVDLVTFYEPEVYEGAVKVGVSLKEYRD